MRNENKDTRTVINQSDGQKIEVEPITTVIVKATGEHIKIEPTISHVNAVKAAVAVVNERSETSDTTQ